MPARVPARAKNRPACSLVPSDWRREDGDVGPTMPLAAIPSHSTSLGGRGLLREEHDSEAFSRPSDAIFSSLPPPFFVYLFLSSAAHKAVYTIISTVATNRFYMFGGGWFWLLKALVTDFSR